MQKILIICFFFYIQNVYSIEIAITEKEAQGYMTGEYNRGIGFNGDLNAIGKLELNKRLSFKSGFSLGFAKNITEIKTFANTGFDILKDKPLGIAVSYIYKGLPGFNIHSHTLLPVIFWNMKYWGITLGHSFRFTSFFGEKSIFEPILSFSIYANFINNETVQIGVCAANFGNFYAGNFSSYSLCFYSDIRINKLLSLINEVEFLQSGSTALSANFYGIALRSGVKFTW